MLAAIPPATLPAMAAVFELLPPVGDFEGEGEGDLAEDTLEEDVGVTEPLEEPGIRPGPSSGESIKNEA